ncbi:MAG: quinone-dependent dihydroorotate dehydrogenase [Rhizobiaceae bacterium]|nr:quinone-dependent dihydroorotate dehydrogenase [Rhizobiaceae bacterium]
MNNLYTSLGKRTLFSIDAEMAHGLSITALRLGLHPRVAADVDPRLAVSIAGLEFPNPLGMAAGYDKNGEVPDALLKMGFGHAEIGTVTPLPQPGNAKPRIFRLQSDQGVINRLGFNSKGHNQTRANLQSRTGRSGIVGINLGANKTSTDFAADYVSGIHKFADLATYFTVNISSPNTPGLRALQKADQLSDLLQRVGEARREQVAKHGRSIPLFLKIAPDLEDPELDDIAATLTKSDADALIVSNTTLARDGLTSKYRDQVGGLSGKPLFERSTIILAKMRLRLPTDFPLIGVGGIHSAETAFAKIEAGANLVQLYSGMVYQGPGLPGAILNGLRQQCDEENLTNISQAVGRSAKDWANIKLG